MMLFRQTAEAFRVISGRSGNEVERFADCRVAFAWIAERHKAEGPHGPGYYVKDRWGREIPPLATDGVLGTQGGQSNG